MIIRGLGNVLFLSNLVFFIAILFGFIFDLVHSDYLIYFCVLLLVEQVSQEGHRILIAFRMQNLASITFFLRSGLWPVIFVALSLIDGKYMSLETLFITWAVTSLGSALVCFAVIFSTTPKANEERRLPECPSLGLEWYKSGLRTAATFFLSSLALKGLFLLDRVYLDAHGGVIDLAAYVFYISSALAIQTFISATIFAFYYPRIIEYAASQRAVELLNCLRSLFNRTVILFVTLAVGLLTVLPVFLTWIDVDTYRQNATLLIPLLGVSLVFCLSMIPHYLLYAFGRERLILISNLLGFVGLLMLFEIFTFWIEPLYAVAWSLLGAFLILATLKVIFAWLEWLKRNRTGVLHGS